MVKKFVKYLFQGFLRVTTPKGGFSEQSSKVKSISVIVNKLRVYHILSFVL